MVILVKENRDEGQKEWFMVGNDKKRGETVETIIVGNDS